MTLEAFKNVNCKQKKEKPRAFKDRIAATVKKHFTWRLWYSCTADAKRNTFRLWSLTGKCGVLMSGVNWEHWWGVRGFTTVSNCDTDTREHTPDWSLCQALRWCKWKHYWEQEEMSEGLLRLLTPNSAILKIFFFKSTPAAQALH